tara:strand:- start:105 stop:362 length:258 start_codon:yes stop_codon:yes gene_type:complete
MKSNKIIEELNALSERVKSPEDKKIVNSAVLEISRLKDENQSVWDLIEEIKESDIKNYKKQLEAAVASKTLSALTLIRNKSNEKN